METRPHRPTCIASAALRVTVLALLVAPHHSQAARWRDITDLSIEELGNIEIAKVSKPPATRGGRISAIVTVSSESADFDSVNQPFAGETQYYNRPNPDPGIYAAPSDMGFGARPSIVGAIRALGPGS